MKHYNIMKSITGLLIAMTGLTWCSCTEDFKFGNSFLEKAPGGTVTADSVFDNPEYTRQFLAAIYSQQYYSLPCRSSNGAPQCLNYWKGHADALSDTHQLMFNNTRVFDKYYTGALTSDVDEYGNANIYPYTNEYIWENVRHCYVLIENIERVPDMSDTEKERMKDEARCLIASAYCVAFRHYGGLPIITGTFSSTESNYQMPRASVEATVNFMTGLLDEVINGNHLAWGYTGSEAATETGRWTIAGAMALKCKILQFAASPLFNADQPYFAGKYTMQDELVAWYGGYKPELWRQYKQACADFFNELANRGIYHLVIPAGNTQEDYRYAFRSAYLLQSSPEVIYGERVSRNTDGNDYQWFNLRNNDRMSYCPTQEFVEMFPWADGRPFNWEETETAGELDQMFVKGDTVADQQMLQNRVYTRDPRLYETVAVNGALQTINWTDGKTSGANYENWVGGTTAGNAPKTNTGMYATGYRHLKYIAGEEYAKKYPHWVWLSLSEMYLNYAEALVQADGNLTEAIKYVDAVRARVGMKGLVECNPGKNLTTDKEALLEEILRERACELDLQDSRYFDMIRYKRADLFERPLHGLRIYRMKQNAEGVWERSETQWYNSDRRKATKGTADWYEPSHFEYERFVITTGARYWWTDGFDPKWYLQPLPVNEVNKGYGLTQNAGW